MVATILVRRMIGRYRRRGCRAQLAGAVAFKRARPLATSAPRRLARAHQALRRRPRAVHRAGCPRGRPSPGGARRGRGGARVRAQPGDRAGSCRPAAPTGRAWSCWASRAERAGAAASRGYTSVNQGGAEDASCGVLGVKAVVCTEARLEPLDGPAPVPGKGQVRIEVLRCGICGSDLHAREHCDELADVLGEAGYDGFMRSDQRVVFGHEFCGVVAEHGPGCQRKIASGHARRRAAAVAHRPAACRRSACRRRRPAATPSRCSCRSR